VIKFLDAPQPLDAKPLLRAFPHPGAEGDHFRLRPRL